MKLLRGSLCFAMLEFLLAGVSPASAQSQNYVFGRADFSTGTGPIAIATGDFNEDGILDLAVVNESDNTISILLGKPDGTFASQVTYATGAGPLAIATGDFDGDGNLDLAITNGGCVAAKFGPDCTGQTVSILLGIRDGTFLPHVDYATGKEPSGIAAGDFNGDGKLDLAVANALDNSVSILLGNGDGTFQAQVVYPAAPNSQSVIVADFNGDHKMDLAVATGCNYQCSAPSATPTSNGVAVLLGNGDGTFQQKLDSPGGAPLAAADFNLDGKLDLFAGGNVLLGNGDGTFVLHATYPSGAAAVTADLNGDGKPDLVLAQGNNNNLSIYSVSVLLGNGDGTFQTAVQYGTAIYPVFVVIADFNGDGKLDLAVADPNCLFFACSTPGVVSVLLGFGDGSFVGQTEYPFPFASPLVSVFSADFNGDGKPDIAALGSALGVFLGNGDGTFQPEVTTALPQSTYRAMATADFNGDGKTDAVTLLSNCSNNTCLPGDALVLIGNGDGTFQNPVEYTVGLEPADVVVGDFNGDGKPDIAVSNFAAGTVSILLNKGDGTFQSHVDYTVGSSAGPIVTGSFRNNGMLDLAVVSSQGVSILLGNGNGTFSSGTSLSTGDIGLVAADFNGDGKLDLVTISTSNIFIYLGNGDGTFQTPVAYPNGIDVPIVGASVGDFNGKPSLIATSDAFPVSSILLGNGDGSFRPPMFNFLSGSTSAVADFNNDGSPDVAALTPISTGSTAVTVMLSAAFDAVSPSSINFGSQGVGTTSAIQIITLSNPSNVDVNITSIAVSGDYSQTNPCGAKVVPGASCTISVRFDPTATEARAGAIRLTDSTRSSPQVIPLTGSGVNGPFLDLSSGHLLLTSTAVGSMSAPQSVTLTNAGNAMLAAPSVGISGGNAGDFTETNTCASGLAPGAACSVSVTFTPTGGGTRVAALTITSSAPGSPQTVSLTGTSPSPRVALSPASLTFGGQGIGTTSAAQSVTLSNIGNAAVSIATISMSGDFAETNNCGASVAAGGTCQISVTFTPTTSNGSRTGVLTVADSASGSPQTVSLSGTALSSDVTLSPATLLFSAQVSGTTSAAQNVSLSNAGNAALSITAISTSGDFAETNKCGTSLAAGGLCLISVTFTPTAGGSRTGTLTVVDGALGSSQMVTLTGTGQDFSLAASGSASATVMAGQTATYTIALTPGGGLNPSVTLTCSGAPAMANCSISPATVTLSGTTATTATVTVTTTAASQVFLPGGRDGFRRIGGPPLVLAAWLVTALALFSLYRARGSQRFRWAPAVAMALLVLAGLGLVSCGGGNSSGGGGTGTEAGTYTITVSASATAGSTALNHSAKLTLVVQ